MFGGSGYFSGPLSVSGTGAFSDGLTASTGFFADELTALGGITSSTGYFNNIASGNTTGSTGYFNNLSIYNFGGAKPSGTPVNGTIAINATGIWCYYNGWTGAAFTGM